MIYEDQANVVLAEIVGEHHKMHRGRFRSFYISAHEFHQSILCAPFVDVNLYQCWAMENEFLLAAP